MEKPSKKPYTSKARSSTSSSNPLMQQVAMMLFVAIIGIAIYTVILHPEIIFPSQFARDLNKINTPFGRVEIKFGPSSERKQSDLFGQVKINGLVPAGSGAEKYDQIFVGADSSNQRETYLTGWHLRSAKRSVTIPEGERALMPGELTLIFIGPDAPEISLSGVPSINLATSSILAAEHDTLLLLDAKGDLVHEYKY